MPFWKPSDDPWDRKPEARRPEPKEPKESPIDSLKQWNEDRKAAAKEKEQSKRLPPEPCPWCGKDMEQGFLTGGRDLVGWYPGIPRFDPFRSLSDGGGFAILDEGAPFSGYHKTAWLCRECGKLVFSIPESERVYDFPGPQEDEAAGTTQEEGTSEG